MGRWIRKAVPLTFPWPLLSFFTHLPLSMVPLSKQYVATVSEQAAAFEGHPFIVEAGVSLGGQAVKDGINVYRFANRIPLLFEVRTCVQQARCLLFSLSLPMI